MPAMEARGRLPGEPIAIVDIGSNSVRLVCYEGLVRALTPTFNEKVLCGLGRGVATTGYLSDEAVAKALTSLQRFRTLCRTMGITDIRALATAAVRDAANGPQFLDLAEEAIGCEIALLTGPREAQLAALGVVSSIYQPDGVVGDLGGGSLELTEVSDGKIAGGITLPIGGLSLMELSERSPKKAAKIARDALVKAKPLEALTGRTFYAVGGTWRSLARLHMRQRDYPMHVMHNYVIPTRDALDFVKLVERIEFDALLSIESVSSARRPLLAYGAAVMEEIIRQANPKEIVISALGVREGLLYESLPPEEQAQDPLLSAAREFNVLRSRAPAH
ncbi:MAG: exopolyphosphatase, partial [Hyphomicrobiales bacterium]|nr:exopolyphosphatase [Hyphomicrobiales bacterium]